VIYLYDNGGGVAIFGGSPGKEKSKMAQKYTEAQKQSAQKWDAANLDRMSLALPKGSRDTVNLTPLSASV